MMTSIHNRIDEWIARIKGYGAVSAFDFIPGYPAHKTPNPITKYTVAVSENEGKISDWFIGNRLSKQSSGRLHEIELCFRVYAPQESSGASLLRASALLLNAIEAQDDDRSIETLSLSGIGYDTAARVEYRDITARLNLIEEAVA